MEEFVWDTLRREWQAQDVAQDSAGDAYEGLAITVLRHLAAWRLTGWCAASLYLSSLRID